MRTFILFYVRFKINRFLFDAKIFFFIPSLLYMYVILIFSMIDASVNVHVFYLKIKYIAWYFHYFGK